MSTKDSVNDSNQADDNSLEPVGILPYTAFPSHSTGAHNSTVPKDQRDSGYIDSESEIDCLHHCAVSISDNGNNESEFKEHEEICNIAAINSNNHFDISKNTHSIDPELSAIENECCSVINKGFGSKFDELKYKIIEHKLKQFTENQLDNSANGCQRLISDAIDKTPATNPDTSNKGSVSKWRSILCRGSKSSKQILKDQLIAVKEQLEALRNKLIEKEIETLQLQQSLAAQREARKKCRDLELRNICHYENNKILRDIVQSNKDKHNVETDKQNHLIEQLTQEKKKLKFDLKRSRLHIELKKEQDEKTFVGLITELYNSKVNLFEATVNNEELLKEISDLRFELKSVKEERDENDRLIMELNKEIEIQSQRTEKKMKRKNWRNKLLSEQLKQIKLKKEGEKAVNTIDRGTTTENMAEKTMDKHEQQMFSANITDCLADVDIIEGKETNNMDDINDATKPISCKMDEAVLSVDVNTVHNAAKPISIEAKEEIAIVNVNDVGNATEPINLEANREASIVDGNDVLNAIEPNFIEIDEEPPITNLNSVSSSMESIISEAVEEACTTNLNDLVNKTEPIKRDEASTTSVNGIVNAIHPIDNLADEKVSAVNAIVIENENTSIISKGEKKTCSSDFINTAKPFNNEAEEKTAAFNATDVDDAASNAFEEASTANVIDVGSYPTESITGEASEETTTTIVNNVGDANLTIEETCTANVDEVGNVNEPIGGEVGKETSIGNATEPFSSKAFEETSIISVTNASNATELNNNMGFEEASTAITKEVGNANEIISSDANKETFHINMNDVEITTEPVEYQVHEDGNDLEEPRSIIQNSSSPVESSSLFSNGCHLM